MNAKNIVTSTVLALILTAAAAQAQYPWPQQSPTDPRGPFGPVWAGPFITVYPDFVLGSEKNVGCLRLQIEPSAADVYVDGVYAGSASEFDGESKRFDLKPGLHRVEIRTAGHESLKFEARIQKGRTTVYRGMLPLATTPY